MTPPAARTLAEFAVGLSYEVIPNAVIDRAKACIIGTVGEMNFRHDSAVESHQAMKPEAVLARREALEQQGSVTGIPD